MNRDSTNIVSELIENGKMQEFADYFDDNLHESVYPHERYDGIVMQLEHGSEYYFGTLAAHGYDALKKDGIFVLDINNCAIDEERTIMVMELFFTYQKEMSRDGYYVFKKLTNE